MGTSKQAVHKKLDNYNRNKDEEMQILKFIYKIRKDHPSMGMRDLYYKIMPESIGRDAFESLCKTHNLWSSKPKNYRRTTDSSGVVRFDNLLENLVIERLDQVWQSDITYFEISGKFYYITFIIDSFSRRIVGHSTSNRLLTEQTTLPALQMAIKTRNNSNLEGLIFHSDGGGQYYAKTFLELTGAKKIINSMCEYAWENGKAERINGVIKNNYLAHKNIKTFEDLILEVDRSVSLYNSEKPHIKLQRKSPIAFENQLLTLTSQINFMMRESCMSKSSNNKGINLFKSRQNKSHNQESLILNE